MIVPGIEAHQFVYAGRASWRIGTWAIRVGFWRPVLASVVLWLVSGVAFNIHLASTAAGPVNYTLGHVCQPTGGLAPSCILVRNGGETLQYANGEPIVIDLPQERPAGAALKTAQIAGLGGAVTLVVAMATGFMTAVGAFSGRKRYERRGTIRGAVREDWRAAHNDVRRTKKGLKKAGNVVARKRARDADHGEVSDPSWLEAKVLAHADPPQQPKAKKAKGKQARKEADTEWADAVAGIEAERAARVEASRPRLDPTDGPPPAPTHPGVVAHEDPMITEYRRHDAIVEERTRRTLGQLNREAHARDGWVGYEPPAAPVTPISVSEDQ